VKHKEKDVLITGLIALIVLMALFNPATAAFIEQTTGIQLPWITVQQPSPGPSPGPSTPQHITGIVTTDVAAFDSLDIATSRTVGTNVNVYWYALRGGSWILLGSGDAADINVEEQDNDIIYAVVSVPSGQAFYVDYQKILSMNSRAQTVDYKDIDGDNVEEYVFRLDIAKIPYASGTGKYSLPCFNVYLLTYDSSHSLTSPGNITSIGTSKVTKYAEWYTTMSAEKKALAISKVVITAGTSDTSKLKLLKVNVPGVGYLDGSSFEQDVLTSTIKWTYSISNQLYGADYIKLPVNTQNKFEFTVSLECDLASGDDISLKIDIYYLDSTESLASLTDTIYLQA